MRPTPIEQWRAFGELVKTHRLARHFTLRGFARELGVAPSYVSYIEAAQVPPPSDGVMARMAEVLEVPTNLLLTKAGRLSPDTLREFWSHPAIPPILSTIPGMSLEEAQTFCRMVVMTPESSLTHD
jgi:transcriptional regulator with XRE-family HTH domain